MDTDISHLPTLDAVQLAELRSNCGHDLDLVVEVLELYLREGEQIMPMLEHAVKGAELDSLRELAHRFRGGSSHVGAKRMTELCRMLEEASEARASDSATHLVEQVKREFLALTDAILLELKSATA